MPTMMILEKTVKKKCITTIMPIVMKTKVIQLFENGTRAITPAL